MRYVTRDLEKQVVKAARSFPAVILTGPRRAGKTFLLRHLYPRAAYSLLEDPAVVARLRADPHGFLDEISTPAILDEVQNVPEVFALVRAYIDRHPRRMGRWFLTGSQEAPLMQGVTELRLAAILNQRRPVSSALEMTLVHERPKNTTPTRALAPGVKAVAWPDFVDEL